MTSPPAAKCPRPAPQPAAAPPPLLTLEKSITPPEALPDNHHGQEQATVDALEGFGPDDRHEEYDLAALLSPRFDEPSDDERHALFPPGPIQLERRGLTSQIPGTPGASPRCASRDLSNLKGKQWQAEFWAAQTAHKCSTAAKLREAGRTDLADSLDNCHSTFTVAQCNDCGKVQRFPNRCDQFFCAECQPRLSADRRKAVEWWVNLISQPKHVVLTVANLPTFSKGHVQEFKRWWSRLRRRKFASNWQGGFYSLEVTNEGRGWHLHLHALVDAKWIDAAQLATEWSKVTGGIGHIVKVKDARRADYLAEVTKYAVKGVDLAKWSGPDIVTFIEAFTGVRSFGVFGVLYAARTKFAEFIATLKDAKPKCDCGSCSVTYYTESEWLAADFKLVPATAGQPPPLDTRQLTFLNDHQRNEQALRALAR